MSQDLSQRRPDWQPLHEWLAELRADCDQLEEIATSQLDEIDLLGATIAIREREITAHKQQVEREAQHLSLAQEEFASERERWLADRAGQEEALVQQATETDRRLAELDTHAELISERDASIALAAEETARTRQELEAKQAELEQQELQRLQEEEAARATSENESSLLQNQLAEAQCQIEKLENDRAIAHIELEAGQEKAAVLDEVSAQAVELQRELESARDALDAADEELCTLREQAQSGASQSDSELEQQLSEMRDERSTLELELETVRNRSAQLAEMADEEKRRAAEERAVLADELKELRRCLTMQSELLAENNKIPAEVHHSRSTSQAAQAPREASSSNGFENTAIATESNSANGANRETSSGPAADPVIETVMAQFEMLQRDRIKRQHEKRAAQIHTATA